MKQRKQYKITIEDESHLTEVVSVRVSLARMCMLTIMILLLCLAISGLVISFTPLRTLLPGYMKESQRSATEEGLLRLDSLMQAFEENEQYIRNYIAVTDIDRIPGDSAAVSPVSRELTSDSLHTASNLEQKFVSGMEERERFNISVLAPLAADGVSFSPVTSEGIFTNESHTSTTGVVVVPTDESVQCAADGSVIALYRSAADHGYVIIIQHNRGFVTSYQGTGTPLVGAGDQVNSGQIIAFGPEADRHGVRSFAVCMWHNGMALVPYDYLGDPGKRHTSLGESFEAPRGK